MYQLMMGTVIGMLLSGLAIAADDKTTPHKTSCVQAPCAPAQVNEHYEKMVDRIVNERQRLDSASERQFQTVKALFETNNESVLWLIDKAIWVFSALFSVLFIAASVIFTYFFGNTRKEFRKLVEEQQQALKSQLEKESKQLLAEFAQLKQLTHQDLEDVRHYYREKQRVKHVQWIYGAEGVSDIEIIHSAKTKWPLQTYERVFDANWQAEKAQCDAVVFSMKKQDDVQHSLDGLIAKLKKLGEPPLIMFVPKIRLSNTQQDQLDQYSNYSVANFPGTLQTALGNALNNV
ncbi:hypothetical protein [Teredinibacter turnerae]|uniref:hypothetical protein n=1 Tax=Teredinibacter turnerae TaxID=2426 RepID=UPI00040FCCE8|nr:hypothetical protein [Teredinibacter turnerae]